MSVIYRLCMFDIEYELIDLLKAIRDLKLPRELETCLYDVCVAKYMKRVRGDFNPNTGNMHFNPLTGDSVFELVIPEIDGVDTKKTHEIVQKVLTGLYMSGDLPNHYKVDDCIAITEEQMTLEDIFNNSPEEDT